MSQEKVDRYKEHKRNRKKEIRRAKRRKKLAALAGIVVAAALVFWISISGYNRYQDNIPITSTEVNLDALDDYIYGLDE